MAEERQETGKKKGNEKGEVSRNLPRNYRQIGEPGAKKIYVEDYVYTYLNCGNFSLSLIISTLLAVNPSILLAA